MRDHNNERGLRPEHKECGNCGGYPVGIGCYHICFNSVHYYSPEQERADEPFYGLDDDYERYAAERADMANEGMYADMLDAELEDEPYVRPEPLVLPKPIADAFGDDTDIPF
jgi:hypothetical protein